MILRRVGCLFPEFFKGGVLAPGKLAKQSIPGHFEAKKWIFGQKFGQKLEKTVFLGFLTFWNFFSTIFRYKTIFQATIRLSRVKNFKIFPIQPENRDFWGRKSTFDQKSPKFRFYEFLYRSPKKVLCPDLLPMAEY